MLAIMMIPTYWNAEDGSLVMMVTMYICKGSSVQSKTSDNVGMSDKSCDDDDGITRDVVGGRDKSCDNDGITRDVVKDRWWEGRGEGRGWEWEWES